MSVSIWNCEQECTTSMVIKDPMSENTRAAKRKMNKNLNYTRNQKIFVGMIHKWMNHVGTYQRKG